ncbi:MAG TPA: hypothetical protein VF032_19540 [Thermoleophilaceae bacterium]
MIAATPPDPHLSGAQGPATVWYLHDRYKPRGGVTVSYDPSVPEGNGRTYDLPGGAQMVLSPAQDPGSFLHELGHAFDDESMTDAARAKWLQIMRQARLWGNAGAAHTGYPNPPREQFAETYRVITQHPQALKSKRAWQHYLDTGGVSYFPGREPTLQQMRRIRRLLADVSAGKYGTPVT